MYNPLFLILISPTKKLRMQWTMISNLNHPIRTIKTLYYSCLDKPISQDNNHMDAFPLGS